MPRAHLGPSYITIGVGGYGGTSTRLYGGTVSFSIIFLKNE